MKAKAKYVRITPRKARLVADEVRGKSYPEAVSLLRFTNKRAAKIIGDIVRAPPQTQNTTTTPTLTNCSSGRSGSTTGRPSSVTARGLWAGRP